MTELAPRVISGRPATRDVADERFGVDSKVDILADREIQTTPW